MGVAVDESGDVLLAGSLIGTIDFGGGPLASMGGDLSGGDVFVAKLDGGGNHVWSRRFGDSYGQGAFGVASAGMGGMFVDGSFLGKLDLGGGAPLSAAGARSMFVAKLLTP